MLPSFFRRERPDLEEHPAPIVSYRFQGSIDEIYATLVVRLHHTSAFDNDRLWKFAADFKTPGNRQMGFKLTKKREGSAELLVYCDPQIYIDAKVTFIRYIHDHITQKSTHVHRYRHYICANCSTPVENHKTVQRRLAAGKTDIVCVDCEERVLLIDLIEEKFASTAMKRKVRMLEAQSEVSIENDSQALTLLGHAFAISVEAGQLFHHTPNADLGIDGEIEFKNDQGQPSGARIYLQLKSGDANLYQRKHDGKDLFKLTNSHHANAWHPDNLGYPVMLVIHTSDEQIRWMNASDYLAEHGKQTKQIVFDGEPFTALNLVKLRNRILPQANSPDLPD